MQSLHNPRNVGSEGVWLPVLQKYRYYMFQLHVTLVLVLVLPYYENRGGSGSGVWGSNSKLHLYLFTRIISESLWLFLTFIHMYICTVQVSPALLYVYRVCVWLQRFTVHRIKLKPTLVGEQIATRCTRKFNSNFQMELKITNSAIL